MARRGAGHPIFYRIRKGRTLHSFGDPILEVPLLGRPLGEHHRHAVEANRCELRDVTDSSEIRDSRYFVFDEDLFFTPEFVAAALKLARQSTGSLRFGVATNSFNERYVLPHEQDSSAALRFNFLYMEGGDAPSDVSVPQEIFPSRIRVPDQIVRGGTYPCDQCLVFISRIASPFHLLQANLAANFKRLVKLRSGLPPWLVERVAPVHSRLYVRSLRRLNRFGRNCRVHPSAVLENAVLGDDVEVGANSIVRHSMVGAGTTINENASVVNSVLGRANVVASGNHINLCMTFDEVFLIHGPYQFSIFGRSSAVFAVINCDIRLDQKTISIPTDVGLVDSRQPLLGIAYGHHCKVGGGNIIAAGRIVPNHKRIDPPSNILLKIE
jgi:hypothetical protein